MPEESPNRSPRTPGGGLAQALLKHWDLVLTLLFSLLVLRGILGHEMWRDEIHAWVAVRSSPTLVDVLVNTRYDGHPALWYFILFFLTGISREPFVMQAAHLLLAAAAVFIFLRFSPFGGWQKALFILGYFPFYEYAVISRNYGLGMLLVFIICWRIGSRKSLWPVAAAVFLLAHTHALGWIIALCLGAFILADALTGRRYLPGRGKWEVAGALVIMAAGLLTSWFMTRPPADSAVYGRWMTSPDAYRLARVLRTPWLAYVPLPAWGRHFWNANIISSPIWGTFLSACLVTLFGIVLARRRLILALYLTATLSLLAFSYLRVEGCSRHHGYLFVVLVMCLWLARLPRGSGPGERPPAWHNVLLTAVLALGALAGVSAWARDLRYPFSQGRAAAAYIRERGLEGTAIMGDMDFAVETVAGYLDRQIHYPRSGRYGDFTIFDSRRRSSDFGDEDVLEAAGELAEREGAVLLVMNRPGLDREVGQKGNLRLTRLAHFRGAVQVDEDFFLYLLKRTGGSRRGPARPAPVRSGAGGTTMTEWLNQYVLSALRPLKVTVAVRLDHDDTLRLYYDDGNTDYPFNDRDSVKVPVRASEGFRKVTFGLPTKDIRRLRLDLGSKPSSVQLAGLSIRHFWRRRSFDADAIRQLLPYLNEVGAVKPEGGHLTLEATGADPFIFSDDIGKLIEEATRLGRSAMAGGLLLAAAVLGTIAFVVRRRRSSAAVRPSAVGRYLAGRASLGPGGRRNAMLLILAAALVLRLQGLGLYWLNPDEGLNDEVVTRPSIAEMNKGILANAHPPLYYYALRAMTLAGDDIAWLRLLSVICGTLSVYLIYLLGREGGGEGTGLLAALMLAFSPGAVTISQVLRPYMLLMALLLSACLFLARHLAGGGRRQLALYALCLTAAIFTSYAAFVAVAGLGLFFLARLAGGRIGRRELTGLALAHLPAAAGVLFLYLWHIRRHLMGSYIQKEAQSSWLRSAFISGPSDVWTAIAGFLGYALGAGLVLPTALLFALGVFLALRRHRPVTGVLPPAMLAAALIFSAAGQYPFGNSRHSIYLLPFLILPAAYGLASILAWRRRRSLPALAALILAGGLIAWIFPGMARQLAEITPIPERFITMEDHRSLLPAFRRARETPGLVLTDVQSYATLYRDFGEGSRRNVFEKDLGGYRFEWGRRTVLMNNAWIMRVRAEDEVNYRHLVEFIPRIRKGMPRADLRGDVRVIYAGWGWPIVDQLRSIRWGLAREVEKGHNVGIFRFKAVRYLRIMKRLGRGAKA